MKKLFCKALLLTLICFVARAGSLELSAPLSRQAAPRRLVTLGFKVKNTSNQQLELQFQPHLPQLWELLRTPDPRSLPAGEEIIVPITVLIPQQVAGGVYELELVVKCGSQLFRAIAQVEVESYSGAKLSFQERELVIAKGNKAAVAFVLENTGNCPERYWLRGRGLSVLPISAGGILKQGETREVIAQVTVPSDSAVGPGWLEIEVGKEGDVGVLARARLPYTIVSAPTSSLSPTLRGKLSLELHRSDAGLFSLQGSFLGNSNFDRGYLNLKLEHYLGGSRSQISWHSGNWALAVGDLYLAGNSLQEPVEERGLLFTLKERGKFTNFFWYPGYFSYRMGPTSVAIATDKQQQLWVYGRGEAGQKTRLWGEVGMPVAGSLSSSSTAVRLGGQRKNLHSFWTADWLCAGATTWGNNQDLWRLNLTGQYNPLLLSYSSQHSILCPQVGESRGTVGVAFALGRGNIILRLGQGQRTSLNQKLEEQGWELNYHRRWGTVYLYLAQSAMPLYPSRHQMRLGHYTGGFSTWLALDGQEDYHELKLGLLWRRGGRTWEVQWQGQEDAQNLTLNLTQPLDQLQSLRLGAKITMAEATSWQFTVGYGVGLNLPIPFLKTKGSLQGRVFIDENNDGIWQSQEQVVTNVGILLGGELVMTDINGLYTLPAMEPGEYTLLLATDLPVGLLAPTRSASIRLHGGERTNWDWPLVRGGSIRGKILLADGKAGGIRIAIWERGRIVARTTADPQGNFQTPYLLPGSYQLQFPQLQDYEPEVFVVDLEAGQEKELELLFRRKSKPQEELFRSDKVQIIAIK